LLALETKQLFSHLIIWVLHRPEILCFLVLTGTVCVVGVVLHFILAWATGHLPLRNIAHINSDAYGAFLSIIGVLYAVLLAFVVVSAWQQYDHTEEVSLQEESDVSDLFHVVGAYSGSPKTVAAILNGLMDYAIGTYDEYSEMQTGDPLCLDRYPQSKKSNPACTNYKPSLSNNQQFYDIEIKVLNLRPSSPGDQMLFGQAVALVDTIRTDRNHRRHHYTEPPLDPILWYAFFLGGLILVGVPYLFRDKDRWYQLIRTATLSAMIGVVIALAAIFDSPFTGSGAIRGDGWLSLHCHFVHDLGLDKKLADDPNSNREVIQENQASCN